MAKPEIFKSVIYDVFSPTFPYVSQRWIWREKYLIWSPSATCPHCASHTDDGLALMLCLVQAGLKGTKILPKWGVFTANSENISSIKVKTTLSTMNDYLLLVENAVNEAAAAQKKFKAVFRVQQRHLQAAFQFPALPPGSCVSLDSLFLRFLAIKWRWY